MSEKYVKHYFDLSDFIFEGTNTLFFVAFHIYKFNLTYDSYMFGRSTVIVNSASFRTRLCITLNALSSRFLFSTRLSQYWRLPVICQIYLYFSYQQNLLPSLIALTRHWLWIGWEKWRRPAWLRLGGKSESGQIGIWSSISIQKLLFHERWIFQGFSSQIWFVSYWQLIVSRSLCDG